MKKITLSIIAIAFAINFSYAQYWTGGPTGPIYYNGGNVGIGTSSPGNTLDVNGGISTNGSSNVNGVTFNTVYTYYRQLQAPGYNLNILSGDGNSLLFLPYASSTAYARFQNYGLVIDGNVGIGTTSPATTLDVAGAGTFTVTSPSPFNTVQVPLILSNGAGNGGAGAQINFSVGSATSYINSVIDGSNSLSGSALTFGTPSTGTTGTERMRITSAGNVLIGKTSQSNTAYILDVAGETRANEVVVNTSGADFVFAPSYKLNPLSSLEKYITKNHHLPEIPSAKQMQADGLSLGENQTKLLQKVEELTLYLIDLKKDNDQLRKYNAALQQAQKTINHKLKIHHIN